MRPKFTNKKCVYDGHKFDSRLERSRYYYLKKWETVGFISQLEVQKKFFLGQGDKTWGKRFYKADFVYQKDGEQIIEDTKSTSTVNDQNFLIKKQRMAELGHEVRIVFKTDIGRLRHPIYDK